MYDELVKRLRVACMNCKLWDGIHCCINGPCDGSISIEAADALAELMAKVDLREKVIEDYRTANMMLIDKFPKWIPCSERLPDYDEEVLVADFCSLGWCMHVWYRTHDGKGTDYWEAEDGHFVGINYAEYWMPLPEPPKEET